MSTKHLKIGDTVEVLAGNDKGKQGDILAIGKGRVVVKGVNVRKKHRKQQQEGKKEGLIVEMEAPINSSNIMFVSPEGKRTKLRVRNTDEGKELYYLDSNKEPKAHRMIKKQKKD